MYPQDYYFAFSSANFALDDPLKTFSLPLSLGYIQMNTAAAKKLVAYIIFFLKKSD